ncbi:hypothetical protein BDZ90DRAFT_186903 [Jaminaea rosea]|uniref:Uncharacterized protein n=1 Tax=Jaminaea rosea TaxID=1569628 RepID=A0A316UPB9_9BASI|nr:hypothetical protein BDZ90DRAFT_186903 [Jaminaea rosea]PWN27139.1 hypothetical protein BDZ90DRAFT_186903 [Jaminaea rosea]
MVALVMKRVVVGTAGIAGGAIVWSTLSSRTASERQAGKTKTPLFPAVLVSSSRPHCKLFVSTAESPCECGRKQLFRRRSVYKAALCCRGPSGSARSCADILHLYIYKYTLASLSYEIFPHQQLQLSPATIVRIIASARQGWPRVAAVAVTDSLASVRLVLPTSPAAPRSKPLLEHVPLPLENQPHRRHPHSSPQSCRPREQRQSHPPRHLLAPTRLCHQRAEPHRLPDPALLSRPHRRGVQFLQALRCDQGGESVRFPPVS